MAGTKPALAFATWTTSQCPFAIDYLPQVLEEIRMAVVSAYHGLGHGGLEIGGILLGRISVDRVAITDFRPLRCEHAFGPTFQLSTDDHVRMAAVIAGAQADGLTIVGWFHSHTRTEIFLSEADLEIHNRYFTHPRQVALVLKPATLKPTLFGFFFRDPDGSIHSKESYREFELASLSARDAPPRVDGPERGETLIVPDAPHPRLRPRATAEPSPTARELVPGFHAHPAPTPAEEGSNGDVVFASPDSRDLDLPPRRPSFLDPLEPVEEVPPLDSKRALPAWAWALLGFMIALALGATYLFLNHPIRDSQTTAQLPAAEPELALKIQRQGEDLVLTWDRNAPGLLGATSGLLSIKDGPTQKEIGLTAEQLNSASILISPENDHVEIQLTILLPNQRTVSESGVVVLPERNSAAPVEFKTTVPAKTYAPAEIQAKSPQVKHNRLFVAPSARHQAAEPQLTDLPPALSGAVPAVQTHAPPAVAVRTFTNLPPPPAAQEPPAGPAVPSSTSQGAPAADEPVFLSSQPAVLVARRAPIYPAEARIRHIKGVVVLEGLIGTNGKVKQLRVISGPQPLRLAALEAVRQWVYKPAKLNNKSVEAPLQVEVQFHEGM